MDPVPVFQVLPEVVVEEILARLPAKSLHRCRCLSLAWAAKLSSHDFIDHHLQLRGKIRLRHDDIMKILVLRSCDHRRGDTKTSEAHDDDDDKEEEGEEEKDDDDDKEGEGEEKEEEEKDGDGNGDGEEEEKEEDWDVRGEYRTRGYVEVNEDYYVRSAEMQAWLEEEWAKMDFSGLTFADYEEDEQLRAFLVPYGALDPRLRQRLMADDSDGEDQRAARLGVHGHKTDEEIDDEIVAFLRACRHADPQFLKELHTYRWPYAEDEDDDYQQEDDDLNLITS